MKLNVIECYPCIQGEGKYAGVPHILIRMTGCKLRCAFKNTLCDTMYASWFPEKSTFTEDDIATIFENHPQIVHTLITGGGPTQSPEALQRLVSLAKSYGHFVTIETEGSSFVKTDADFISLSPKLASSTPTLGMEVVSSFGKVKKVTKQDVSQHEEGRTNYAAMKEFINHISRGFVQNYQVKFVVTNLEEDLSEIDCIIEKLNIPDNTVYLMPEGITDEQLSKNRQLLMEECIKRGWNYTDRLHIIAFGNKRGV